MEIRSLDISVFDPCGINQNTMRFMEALLIYCLLKDSPELDDAGLQEAMSNQTGMAKFGRDPGFRLSRDGEAITVRAWANEIIGDVLAVAEELDRHDGNDSYAQAVRLMQTLADDPDATPSARIIRELEDAGTGFFGFAFDLAKRHKHYFASITQPDEATRMRFVEEAAASLQRQKDIEAADSVGLDEYLQDYFS